VKQNWPEGVKAIFGIKKIPGYVGGKSEVQSLIFNKNNWSIQKAKNWLVNIFVFVNMIQKNMVSLQYQILLNQLKNIYVWRFC